MSTAVPTCTITNTSTVVNAANLQWVFEFKSPSGTPIHIGDFGTPDVDGVAFTTFTFSESIPLLFGQLEFGPDQYTVKVLVKDSADVIFDLTKGDSICKPNGNENKGNFGKANIDIETRCGAGQLYVTDKTNLIYKSVAGTKVTTQVELTYPLDENGNELTPISVAVIPSLLPIKYEGDGHEIYVAHVYDYDLGDNFIVRVRYSFSKVFGVWCNVNLQPLLCEVATITAILEKNCFDTEDNRTKHKKLGLANSKILQAVIGVIQPLTGFDVPAIVEDVKRILEIECDCCRPAGISNVGTALVTDAVFTVNKICGDALLSWTNDGNGNITLNYQDVSYTFDTTGSDAFTFGVDVSGCVKNNVLAVDMDVLAGEILTNITNNQTYLNILNSITQKASLTCTGLDGGDAFDFTTCDYSIEIDTTAVGKTFVSILIDGATYTAPGGTLVTAASTIQTYLNSLAKGTFVVSYSSGTNKTTITTDANANAISTISTLTGSTTTVTQFNNNCGLICTILQRILDYFNALNLVQIKSGGDLTICRFNADGTVLSKDFDSDATAYSIAKYMADSLCNVVNYAKDKLLSCANIQALFATFTDATGDPDGADIFFMNLNGGCQKVPLKNVAISIIKQIRTDNDVKNEFCLISPCSSISNCSPVADLLQSAGTDTTETYTWSTVAGAIGYKWSIDGTNYTLVTSTTAFISGLTANTSYTFRVFPVYAFGDGVSCEITDIFITTNTGVTCAAPANLVLDNVTDTSFRATWDAVTGATGYQYRVNGAGWVNAGLVLTVSPSGLTPDTIYNFEVRAIIGGTPCVDSSTDSVTTGASSSINFHAINNVTGLTVTEIKLSTGIVPYVFIAGSLPLAVTEEFDGGHFDFTGILRVIVTGTFVPSCLALYIDGLVEETQDITAAGTYNFTTRAYITEESIDIQLTEGTCT